MRTVSQIFCLTCALILHAFSQIDSTLYVTLDQPAGLPEGKAFNDGGNYYETIPVNPIIGETDGWFNSTGTYYWGGSIRRIPRLVTASLEGASVNYTISLAETGYYLAYLYMGYTSNSTDNALFSVASLPEGTTIRSVQYSIKDISAGIRRFTNDGLIPVSNNPMNGTWMPVTAFPSTVPNAEYRLSISGDSKTNVFLRADAIRLRRSIDKKDLEFGRRERNNFGTVRTPELFPETNLGESFVRTYPFWNLGTDTLTVYSIEGLTKRFKCKTATPFSIPPHSVADVLIEFKPFEEEYVVDTLTIRSNDDTEAVAAWVLAGEGVNYNFILNASDGSEPMWNVPGTPSSRFPSYPPPMYWEKDTTWFNSVAAPALYPIHFGNISSRVTRDTLQPFQECQFEFTIPPQYEGRYTIGFGGPVTGNASTNIQSELITLTTADTQRAVSFNANNYVYMVDYKPVTPLTLPFYIQGDMRMLFRWYAKSSSNSFLRMDLIRFHKIPEPALPLINNALLDFGNIAIVDSSGHQGPYAVKSLIIQNNGERLFLIKDASFTNGSIFTLQGDIQDFREVPAVGAIELPIMVKSPAAGSHTDTLIITTERPDSTFVIIVKGNSITNVSKDLSPSSTEFALRQNYPNPFNPSTTIRYALPSSANVRLTIHDVLGREIATLVNEEQSAGWKEVSWNAGTVASGIYFFKLTAGNFTGINKMVLLK